VVDQVAGQVAAHQVEGQVVAHQVVDQVAGQVAAHQVVDQVAGQVAAHQVVDQVAGQVVAHQVAAHQLLLLPVEVATAPDQLLVEREILEPTIRQTHNKHSELNVTDLLRIE
jgi:hypothetical protein